MVEQFFQVWKEREDMLWHCLLGAGVGNLCFVDNCPVQFLLKCSLTHFFTYCVWLCQATMAELSSYNRICMAWKPKIFIIWPFKKAFSICSHRKLGFPSDASGKEPSRQFRTHETQIWSLGQEYPLEEGVATHSSILAWKIPWTEKPGVLWSIGWQRVRQDWSKLSPVHSCHRKWKECLREIFSVNGWQNFVFFFFLNCDLFKG